MVEVSGSNETKRKAAARLTLTEYETVSMQVSLLVITLLAVALGNA